MLLSWGLAVHCLRRVQSPGGLSLQDLGGPSRVAPRLILQEELVTACSEPPYTMLSCLLPALTQGGPLDSSFLPASQPWPRLA